MTTPRPSLLARLGLDRPVARAWALYDVGNSAFVTTVVTAVYPVYFATVAARGLEPREATARWALATTVGLALAAALAPFLGALADAAAAKKRLLAGSVALGSAATAGLFLVGPGDWVAGAALFVVASAALNASFVFYDALLPHVAPPGEVDRVSSAGYALGYLGGGVLLAAQLAAIERPGWFGLPAGPGLTPAEATLPARLAFLSTALWWVAFTLPLLRRVPEPPATAHGHTVRAALSRLAASGRALRGHPAALRMLVAFLVYNDGIGTMIRMATVYGAEIGIDRAHLVGAILLVQFAGVPFAFLFGALAGRIGAKRAVLLALLGYLAIALLGWAMRTALHFYLLALGVAVVQGGAQALSRSLFASLVPRRASGEFFGFFAVAEKAAGLLGPAVFLATAELLDSSRAAVLSVVAFFLVGGLLLLRVDVEGGRRAARAADGLAG